MSEQTSKGTPWQDMRHIPLNGWFRMKLDVARMNPIDEIQNRIVSAKDGGIYQTHVWIKSVCWSLQELFDAWDWSPDGINWFSCSVESLETVKTNPLEGPKAGKPASGK